MNSLEIRTLTESDLDEAVRVFRLAFGTQSGLPDPLQFRTDSDLVSTRWRNNTDAAWGAWQEGSLIGVCVASLWGSLGVIGPISVSPDHWGGGVAQQLLSVCVRWLDEQGVDHIGLSTLPASPKHLMLYRKFGFWPRYLAANLSKEVAAPGQTPAFGRYTQLGADERAQAESACLGLCDECMPGLDLTSEIRAVLEQDMGETLLLMGEGGLEGFAICHLRGGSEAESGTCSFKFGAVRGGQGADARFNNMLLAVDAVAAERGLHTILAGCNYARGEALEQMLQYGYRLASSSVAMHRPNQPIYNRSGVYLVDDWR